MYLEGGLMFWPCTSTQLWSFEAKGASLVAEWYSWISVRIRSSFADSPVGKSTIWANGTADKIVNPTILESQ